MKRRESLTNTDFSIICNNCWAGYVYRRYKLPYATPFIGLYLFAEDYVKLCENFKFYTKQPIEFIDCKDSKYCDIIAERNQQNVPIGKLHDVEIIFLHYKTQEEAKEKWERRIKRINYDNLIFKFSKMNYCTDEHLKRFDSLKAKKKFCFVPPEDAGLIKCGVPFKSAKEKKEVGNDTLEYSKYIDIEKLINAETVCGLNMTKAK